MDYELPDSLANSLNILISELEKELLLDGVYIYGSYINGNPTRWSDLDVVVVSKDFEKMEKTDRVSLIRRIKINNSLRELEVKGVSSAQWERGFGFLGKVKRMAISYIYRGKHANIV